MTNERETVHLSDLLHFSPKQKEAWQAVKNYMYTLYGGAMAGGKSYFLRWVLVALLVMWAKRGHRNVEVGLFCEDYPTLKDRQLSKIGSEFPSWLGTLHGDHAQHGRCYILAAEYGGGIIKFRNLDDPSKYQSAEFAAIGVDELTKNAEDVFTDLRNRLRWPGITDVRFIGATNPGGIGHSWVKKLWLDRIFGDNETQQDQFKYVRALAQDNPHIDKSYLKQLESLPLDKRRAYLEGDWDIFKGQYFTEWRREVHICEPFEIPQDWRRFCALDYGYRPDPLSLGWYAIAPWGQVYRYREVYGTEMGFTDLAQRFVSLTSPYEKIEYIVADTSMWTPAPEREDRLSGQEVFTQRVRELLKGTDRHCPPMQQAVKERVVGWRVLREYLRPFLKDGVLTSQLQVFSTCTEFIRTVPALIHDDRNPEDVDSDGEDHAGDEVRYAVMSRPRPKHTLEEIGAREFQQAMKRKQQLSGRKMRFVK